MIQAQAMAARIACARMTIPHLTELHDSVERACCLAARSQWDRKAAAHAEIFSLLADVVDDPLLAPLLTGGAGYVRELMLAVVEETMQPAHAWLWLRVPPTPPTTTLPTAARR